MNREYIAQNLCEKREQEDQKLADLEQAQKVNKFAEQFGLRCAGSCQLRKQLAEADHQQDNAPVSSIKYTLDVLFLEQIYSFVPESELVSFENPIQNGFYQSLISVSELQGIFHPPLANTFKIIA